MDTKAIITFDKVSLTYRLHHGHGSTLKQMIIDTLRGSELTSELFWALKDISVSISRGKTLGIIGENGSGKSSMLKMIAGIIEPSKGNIRIQGRVSALLELGAGFHPDLTGRQNLFLNGSILGLSSSQLKERFQEIVSFAGLQKFIDSPVKTYSSGMYVRLGFAIAVHVDPDILLADEILSVGDAEFQTKSLQRMKKFKNEGKTIIVVSHNLPLIEQHTDRVLVLDEGAIIFDGEPQRAVYEFHQLRRLKANKNLEQTSSRKEVSLAFDKENLQRWGSKEIEIKKVLILNQQEDECYCFQTGEKVIFRIFYKAHQRIQKPSIGIAIHREDGVHITGPNTTFHRCTPDYLENEGYLDYIIEDLPLLAGNYLFTAAIYDYDNIEAYDHHDRLYPFRVFEGGNSEIHGLVSIPCQWSFSGTKICPLN